MTTPTSDLADAPLHTTHEGVTLVTGAAGHLGANLVRSLLERGERVRVLARKGSDNRAIDGLDVEVAHGDITDTRSLADAAHGCARIYHCAALVSIRDIDRQRLFDVNVIGTRNVLNAAKRAGVARTVVCSSFGAVGHNPDGTSTEHWALNPFESTMHYEHSKAFAEMEVLRAVTEGVDACIVNPTGIIGPHDFKPSHIGQTLADWHRGRVPLYIRGAFDFVPAIDVVQGMQLAMQRGRPGRRYILSGEIVTLDQIFGWWTQWAGARRRPLAIDGKLLLPFIGLKDAVERRLFPSSHPRFTRSSVELLMSGRTGSNARARRELGLVPTSIEQAFWSQYEWFAQQGLIPAPPASALRSQRQQ